MMKKLKTLIVTVCLLLIALVIVAMLVRSGDTGHKEMNERDRMRAVKDIGFAIESYRRDHNDTMPKSIARDLYPDYLIFQKEIFRDINHNNVDTRYRIIHSGPIWVVEYLSNDFENLNNWGKYAFSEDGKVITIINDKAE